MCSSRRACLGLASRDGDAMMTVGRRLRLSSLVLGPVAVLLATAGSAVSWTTGGVPVGAADSIQLTPVIASDARGGAFIGWEDRRSGNNTYTYLQHLTSDG